MKTQADRPRTHRRAFTLLEVMFAMVAFCTAMFVILALVSNSLANARRLQRPMVDAGVVAAELSQTNQLVEGVKSGDLDELLGNAYQGYPGPTTSRKCKPTSCSRWISSFKVIPATSRSFPK